MSSSNIPNQAELDTAEHFIYVTQVYFCAMYAVVVWDWLISLPREVRFIWRTHWTPVKAAYLFCRYWCSDSLLDCFVLDHSLEFCEKYFRVPVALALWNQVGSESVLLIRTYAFFNRNIYVLWLLISALSGVVAYQIYVDSAQMLLLPFFKPPFDKGPCFPRSKPHSAHLLGFFVGPVLLLLRHANRRQIAPLAFDTIVTAMTVVKAINIRRRNGSPNSRLIQTFLREGVFYYILISIANLINGIFYLQPRQVISALNIPLSVVLSPVIATRLILDLRERGSETVSHSEGTGIAAFTTKSMTQQSPFTPPHHRSKSALYTRNTTRTTDSNIVLSTLGSVMPEMDAEVDISADTMDNLHHFGLMELGSLSTAVGGDDGEPIEKDEEHGDEGGSSPAPAYSLEMGFRAASRSPSMDSDVRGIRVTVDVERATSSI
ncbi:hypothetical protein HMN09_00910300 [Mycena chlorophos]|uniref:DUF6533 domain-containing protein n=1 Tax=Mycena chlorophos TaxID=658473 RepID=A0A8H6SPE0_MYCCL|nr:hypothetical protein HMN09_00910300 [Mycena chlorophos]